MADIYIIKAIYERNADDGISHFTNTESLANAVLEAYDAGAVEVRVYRTVEVEYNAYWQACVIDIGKDKK